MDQIEPWFQVLEDLPRAYEESLPDKGWLQRTISECFWASLLAEEARPVRASIVFAKQDEVTQSIRFARPVECKKLCIRQLAAAFDPDAAVLASDGETIWGAALTIPREAAFISTSGHGRLLVRRGPRIIASFEGGEWSQPPDLDDYVQQLVPQLADVNLRRFLLDAAVSMRRLGHGGALIVASGTVPWENLQGGHGIDGFLDTVRTWSEETMAESLAKADPSNRELKPQAEQDRDHRERERRRVYEAAVRLSAIDGAVVFADAGQGPWPVRFGAKITDGKPGTAQSFEQVRFPDESPQDTFEQDGLERLGGTRHQSAARFAALHANVVILVVSQDGRASLMAQVGGKGRVRVLTGFECALPPETTLRFGSYVRGRATGRSVSAGSATATVSRRRSDPE